MSLQIKKPQRKKSSLDSSIVSTQKVVNEYIRKRDANSDGIGRCCSCGKIKKLQAGHYFNTSAFPSIRYDEDNIHGQCSACNQAEKSNYRSAETVKLNYTSFMNKKYGLGKHDELKERSHKVVRFTENTLKEIRKYYRAKIKELEKDKYIL